MIIGSWIAALVIGVVVGLGADELLRGRDPRSRYVVVAGAVGGVAGLIVQRSIGGNGGITDVLAGLVGAILVAFVTRVRISAAIAPTAW
jgi:uncharacterized membrane protein YeaQ/YmgE (transglycosylase-associated protein family)